MRGERTRRPGPGHDRWRARPRHLPPRRPRPATPLSIRDGKAAPVTRSCAERAPAADAAHPLLRARDDRATLGSLTGRADPLLRNRSVVVTAHGACFIYKHAAIVGKLGDNGAALRRALRNDADLHALLALASATVTVLAHTRWASVGRISEANAHPVDSHIAGADDAGPFSIAVLNGDIDNYGALAKQIAYEPDDRGITTDAKVIPVLLSQRLAEGADAGSALCGCLADFAGSMAIAAQAETSDEVLLAVKGSGQSVYVGLGFGGFVVASEVYGLVATTSRYLRVEGAAWPEATRQGTVLALARRGSGTLAAIRRWDGDGVPRPVDAVRGRTAEVTTRDLALDSAVHYLHKEVHEAPSSFRKTLRGRVRQHPAGPPSRCRRRPCPPSVRERISSGQIRQIVVVGQGTAAVAAQGVAQFVRAAVGDRLTLTAMPASEFSASCLYPDMTDVCVVAISQSGTTTDTNRSVDLARDRGAAILSIVNRRDSDLTTKSHGVLYTSDGRDVEMSVASTKAFYAQVAAGCLLGIELGRELNVLTPEREASLIDGLQRIPGQLLALQASEQLHRQDRHRGAARYPYWAVVGSGPNRVAAAEIRIKLSELCYKTISTDAVEDKKHIDLSAEALVIVCAAGAPPGQVSDLIKEVEIRGAREHPDSAVRRGHRADLADRSCCRAAARPSRDDVDRRDGRRPPFRLPRRAPHRRGRRSAAGRAVPPGNSRGHGLGFPPRSRARCSSRSSTCWRRPTAAASAAC